MTDELLREMRGPVMWLTINRPGRRNALTPEVLAGMSAAMDEAQADRSVRAIIITGAGDQAFCAGADLKSGNMFSPDPSEPYGMGAMVFRKARQMTVPMIARVNGACLAGGMGYLAMCDLAIAARHATFGLPEVRVGVFPVQVLSLLQNIVPRRFLTELCITGTPVSAEKALEYGLINMISDDLDNDLEGLIQRILKSSPAAIRRGLYTMKRIEAMSFEESISFTETQIALLGQTEDAREGMAAFREKRQPRWSGK